MSKLKAGIIYADFNRNLFIYHGAEEKDSVLEDDEEVYKKSEADKFIAELEESHKKEVGQLLMEIVKLKEERRWRNVDDKFPTADEGYILVLWEDGLPDIGYIGAEDDVIETVRDRGEGHSVDWWMPLPLSPKEKDYYKIFADGVKNLLEAL